MMKYAESEALVVEQIKGGKSHFDTFTKALLWLACERLKKRGALRAGPIANSYQIGCQACCADTYKPCPEHPILPEPKPAWITGLGIDEYVSGDTIREHALDQGELAEVYRRAIV